MREKAVKWKNNSQEEKMKKGKWKKSERKNRKLRTEIKKKKWKKNCMR